MNHQDTKDTKDHKEILRELCDLRVLVVKNLLPGDGAVDGVQLFVGVEVDHQSPAALAPVKLHLGPQSLPQSLLELRDLGIPDVSEGWDEILMRQCRTDNIRVFSADPYNYIQYNDTGSTLLANSHLISYGPPDPHAFA